MAGRPASRPNGVLLQELGKIPTQPISWAGLSLAKTAISIEDSFVFNPILACLKIGVKLGVGPQLWSFFLEKNWVVVGLG